MTKVYIRIVDTYGDERQKIISKLMNVLRDSGYDVDKYIGDYGATNSDLIRGEKVKNG